MNKNYLRNESAIYRKMNDLLIKKDYEGLQNAISVYNPVDIRDYIEELDLTEAILVFRLLKKEDAVEVFSKMEKDVKYRFLKGMTDSEIKYIIDELYFDDRVDLMEEMPAGIVKNILRNTNEEERNLMNKFLKYPKDSAGSLMTIEYVELKEFMTTEEALEIIKETGDDKVTVYTCYVTNETKKLLGFVTLRRIITAPSKTKISELMDEDVISVHTLNDQEIVANVFNKYGFVVMPVVDSEGRMTGVITVDDILEVMEQEATEDFQRMAAMIPQEEEYLDTSPFKLAKSRVAWLLILMITATFTGQIMNHYNTLIQSMIVLNMFIPMIMDAGGNSGSQSSTLIIRGLATGEIHTRDFFKVIFKEFKVSILVGFIIALVNFTKVLLFDRVPMDIALLISVTLMFTITAAKVIGGILPIAAKKLKMDPAIMAGPLITTVVDTLSLIIYFELASHFIRI